MTARGRARRRRRGGYVLVIFAMMSVGLLGLAAVVIDLGLARATQAQMQTAVDAAALEGLRERDRDVHVASVTTAQRDLNRRLAASRRQALVHDGNFDPSLPDGPDDAVLGAGPNITLTGGIGELNASADLAVGVERLYRPRRAPVASEGEVVPEFGLELNAGLGLDPRNVVHGDLVAGTWDRAALVHTESDLYIRTDFAPAPPGDDDASATAPSFLARLRRTSDLDGLDAIPGVSTGGELALPFLFGLGSAIKTNDPAEPYQPRRDGITVRATAIADGRPVVAVGPPVAGATYGVLPFSISSTTWTSLPEGTPTTLITTGVGPGAGVIAVGDTLTAAEGVATSPGPGYVPIVDAANVVLGFGWLDVLDASGPLVLRRSNAIAPQNATAVPGPLVTPNLPASLAPIDGALLAPVLVR
jgi:hypothetical protein